MENGNENGKRGLEGETVLIADSHLDGGGAEEAFFSMLDALGALSPARIVFLGDIFELWLAVPGYEEPPHKRFLQWCGEHRARFEIGFIEGNHEYYVRSAHKRAFSWISSDSFRDASGTLFIHGDTVNRGDWRYLSLRRLIRNPFTRLLLRLLAFSGGRELADRIRLILKPTNMEHKRSFPADHFRNFASGCSKRGLGRIVAGHFHAGKALGGSGVRIYTLPAWTPRGKIALLSPSGVFRCVPWRTLAGRGADGDAS